MDLQETEISSVVVLAVNGRLDGTTSGELERRLRDIIAGGRMRIVLDLERVAYISSAGLRVLIVAARLLQDGAGQFVLAGLSIEIHRLFEMSGFTALFAIASNRSEAVAQIR